MRPFIRAVKKLPWKWDSIYFQINFELNRDLVGLIKEDSSVTGISFNARSEICL